MRRREFLEAAATVGVMQAREANANLATSIAVDLLVHEQSDSKDDYVMWHGRDEHGNLLLTTTHHEIPQREGCRFCKP